MTTRPELSVEDRLAITELLSGYALYLDQGDMDRWLDLFLPDAVIEVPGQEPVRSREERVLLARTSPKGTHLVAPPVIRAGDGPGEAVAEQSFLFRGDFDGGILSGWYRDLVVKREATWYLSRRSVHYARRSRRRIDT